MSTNCGRTNEQTVDWHIYRLTDLQTHNKTKLETPVCSSKADSIYVDNMLKMGLRSRPLILLSNWPRHLKTCLRVYTESDGKISRAFAQSDQDIHCPLTKCINGGEMSRYFAHALGDLFLNNLRI